ncbi:hypothetical protein XPN_4237, partial [Xanthomonas arboricola pv. pruni MAFF 301427]
MRVQARLRPLQARLQTLQHLGHARAQLAAGVLLPALQQLQPRLRAVRTQ